MTETTCILHKWICTREVKTWEDLLSTISQATQWANGDDVFVYTEALGDCSLGRHPFCDLAKLAPDKPFEGRIFDANVEARWRRLQSGEWHAWTVREQSTRSSDGESARRILRRYYLRGVRDKANHDEFHEARYPRIFKYPVDDTAAGDRAYIEVAEYWRTDPCWSQEECNAIENVRRLLGEPILIAHRFCGVGAGKDTLEQGGSHGDG